MRICDVFQAKKAVVSCEIFPPKPSLPVETVFNTLDQLRDLPLDFISVTYGAGGSSTARSLEIANKVKNHYGIATLAHLTCVGAQQGHIDEVVQELQRANIENILALRGDLPQGAETEGTASDYRYASDLIRHLKNVGNMCIGAAAYPEGHSECPSVDEDLEHLKIKVDAGADFLITQLFFDNNFFYAFMERARRKGINIPISVGVMPILNTKQIERITTLCGATIPQQVRALLARYQRNPEDVAAAGLEFASKQIQELLAFGVDGIHLYTMNKPAETKEILRNTGLI